MLAQGLKAFTEIPLSLFGMSLFIFSYLMVMTTLFIVNKNSGNFKSAANLPLEEE